MFHVAQNKFQNFVYLVSFFSFYILSCSEACTSDADYDLDMVPFATERTNNELINAFNRNGSKHFVQPHFNEESLFETKKSTQTGEEEQVCGGHKSEATLIQLISSVLDAVAAIDEFDDCDNTVPSFNSVLDLLKTTQGLLLDDEQRMAYEIICSTFLLKLISESDDDNDDTDEPTNASVTSMVETVINKDVETQRKHVIRRLHAYGGKTQLFMLLTGPAGAGKSTAVKAAEQFCMQFCKYAKIPWMKSTYLYTAYTGSAAAQFNGVTICKKSGLLQKEDKPLPEKLIDSWNSVKIVIVDEISFMRRSEFDKLDTRLREIGRKDCLFGGFSVIFAGDFRQFEPMRSKSEELLFSLNPCVSRFEQIINTTIILNNEHRYKKDPEWGALLKHFWMKGLTTKHKQLINKRYVPNDTIICDQLHDKGSSVCHACPTHVIRSSIHARLQKMHILQTHPDYADDDQLPPSHTIIIEANMRNSNNKNAKKYLNRVIRQRILMTGGDASCTMQDHKHVDPALLVYNGCAVIYTGDNSNLENAVPRGNGTRCEIIEVKLRDGAETSTKNYYGKKVRTVLADQVEHLKLKKIDESKEMSDMKKAIIYQRSVADNNNTSDRNKRTAENNIKNLELQAKKLEQLQIFIVEPENKPTRVKVRPSRFTNAHVQFTISMTQFPVNLNSATTGHKLQGMSLNALIIPAFPSKSLSALFKNWEYVVLSRVRTLSELYLLEKINEDELFAPTEDFVKFLQRAKTKMDTLIKTRKQMMRSLE